MPTNSTCPHCHAELPPSADLAGKSVHCPECGRVIGVSASGSGSVPLVGASASEDDAPAEDALLVDEPDEYPLAAPRADAPRPAPPPIPTRPPEPEETPDRESAGPEAADAPVRRVVASDAWGVGDDEPSPVRAIRRGLSGALDLVLFYLVNLPGLCRHFAQYFREAEPGSRKREIHVRATDNYTHAGWDGKCWRVELPDLCVVCGQPTDEGWTEELHTVQDLTWSLWSPVAGICAGLTVGLCFWWIIPFWFWFLLGTVVGFVVGYFRRGKAEVRVRFRRCATHAESTAYPRVRLEEDAVGVQVGVRDVKLAFLTRERPAQSVPVQRPRENDAAGAGKGGPPPIPLADDVRATVTPPKSSDEDDAESDLEE